jgi:hypothetical protein
MNSVIEAQIDAAEAEAEKIRLAAYAEPPVGDPPLETVKTDEEKAAEEAAKKAAEEEAARKAEEEAAALAAQHAADDVGEETWKKKYETLKGKYDKELPKEKAAVRAAKAEVLQWQEYATLLEGKVKTLEAAAKIEPKVVKEEVPKVTLDLKDPELETLLQDYPGAGKLLTAMNAEREADKKKIVELETAVNAKLKTFESTAAVSQQDRFNLDMSTLVGTDWRKTDADPAFFEFLDEEVPYTGKTRLQLLKAASAAFDATTVARFFNDFRATVKPAAVDAGAAGDAGADGSAGADGGAGGGDAAAGKLAKFVAPPRSAGGKPPERKGAEPVWTRAQYTKFIDDSIHGKFKPKDWGGKTEAEMDIIFDKAIAAHALV